MNGILEYLLRVVKNEFGKIKDFRQLGKIDYQLPEILLDNLLLFLLQFRSFRQFKQSYLDGQGIVKDSRVNISSSQQKSILDNLAPDLFRSVYRRMFGILQRSKILEKYVYYDKAYLMLIDGSGYYSSNKIKCSQCLIRKGENSVSYQHHVLQLFIASPEQDIIIPLMPEEISNRDGNNKQDCEINAAKRALKLFKQEHPKLKTILVGDDLYSNKPMIEQILAQDMHFILVAKPSNHVSMFEDIEGISSIGGIESFTIKEKNGEEHHFEWVNEINLNGNLHSIKVNYFSYLHSNSKSGKAIYKNSWVTDFKIDKNNVKILANGGRSRWKCENEGFNNLKNQGYHIDHNYGHGTKHLAFNNYTLNLLSFFIHKFCELKDKSFKKCYNKLGSKALIWQKVRDYSEVILFDTWHKIFEYILMPRSGALYYAIPPPC